MRRGCVSFLPSLIVFFHHQSQSKRISDRLRVFRALFLLQRDLSKELGCLRGKGGGRIFFGELLEVSTGVFPLLVGEVTGAYAVKGVGVEFFVLVLGEDAAVR